MNYAFTKQEKVFLVFILLLAVTGAVILYIKRPAPVVTSSPQPSQTEAPAEFKKQLREEVIVYVTGQVRNPGVYRLSSNARIADAIHAAGGASGLADLESINLAEKISDGQKVTVPVKNFGASLPPEQSALSSSQTPGKININAASQEQLESLPGIGPELAKRIMEHRKTRPFQTAEELKDVPGIGDKKFNQLQEMISVN